MHKNFKGQAYNQIYYPIYLQNSWFTKVVYSIIKNSSLVPTILKENDPNYNATHSNHILPPDTPKKEPSTSLTIIVPHRKPEYRSKFLNPAQITHKYDLITSKSTQCLSQSSPPHQYCTLVCKKSRAKLQQKHHDHLVHDAHSKKKQKREKRILIPCDINIASHINTNYYTATTKPKLTPPAFTIS